MISDVISSDGSLLVMGAGGSGPYVSSPINDPRAMSGDVRYNGNMFEVYSSGCWTPLYSNTADVQLNSGDVATLAWARNKMLEEERDKELFNKHPALKKAKENYNTIKALVEHDK